MRPDLRSFSFTWTKGGGTEEPNRSKSIPNFGNSTSDPYQSGKIRKEKEKKKIDKKNYYGCNPSKLRQLKEFGTSFLQFGQSKVAMATKTEYFTIHEEPIEMTDEEEEENSKNENLDPKNDEIEKKSMTLRSANLKNSNSNSNSIGIGGKINKKVQNVKNTFGNLSQKFRGSSRRQYRMATPSADSTPTRKMLGRTPTRMSSPFGFVDTPQTPANSKNKNSKNVAMTTTPILRKTPKRLQRPPSTPLARTTELFGSYSRSGELQKDIQDIGKGFQELQVMAQNVSRRNLKY